MRCLHPDCERAAAHRGNCHAHYNALCRLVRAGVVTWEVLERDGATLPSRGHAALKREITASVKKQKYINDPRRARGV